MFDQLISVSWITEQASNLLNSKQIEAHDTKLTFLLWKLIVFSQRHVISIFKDFFFIFWPFYNPNATVAHMTFYTAEK